MIIVSDSVYLRFSERWTVGKQWRECEMLACVGARVECSVVHERWSV